MHDQLRIGVWRLRLVLEGGFTGDRVTEGNGLESLPARPPTPDTDDAVCTESHPGARLIHQLALNSQHGRPHPFPAIGRLRQDCLSSEVSLDYG